MAAQSVALRALITTRASSFISIQVVRPTCSVLKTRPTSHIRPLTTTPPLLYANPATDSSFDAQALDLRTAPPPEVPDSLNPDLDAVRHASFLGEADSNDGHEANRDAFHPPPPALDARNSAYLGEGDGDDGFEHYKNLEGRTLEPIDASSSSYLGESDSDDGFEGRRAVYPEEGDHRIEDASVSGFAGQPGEGDGEIEL